MKQVRWALIPSPLLSLVCKFLSKRDVLVSTRLVCSQWRNVRPAWTSLWLNNKEDGLRLIRVILPSALHELRTWDAGILLGISKEVDLSTFSNLEVISLGNPGHHELPVGGHSDLIRLRLFSQIDPEIAEKVVLDLKLGLCVRTEFLQGFLEPQNGPRPLLRIRKLELNKLCTFTDEMLMMFVGQHALSLQQLNLEVLKGYLTDTGLECLLSCPVLRCLVLSGQQELTCASAATISRITTLEELYIRNHKQLSTDDALKQFTTLTHLKVLHLGMTNVTFSGLSCLSSTLEHVELISPRFSRPSAHIFLSKFPKLETLHQGESLVYKKGQR
jgi:hypothetical protein